MTIDERIKELEWTKFDSCYFKLTEDELVALIRQTQQETAIEIKKRCMEECEKIDVKTGNPDFVYGFGKARRLIIQAIDRMEVE